MTQWDNMILEWLQIFCFWKIWIVIAIQICIEETEIELWKS